MGVRTPEKGIEGKQRKPWVMWGGGCGHMPWELSASRCAETSVPESTVTSASQVVMSSFALVILKVCGVFFCEEKKRLCDRLFARQGNLDN